MPAASDDRSPGETRRIPLALAGRRLLPLLAACVAVLVLASVLAEIYENVIEGTRWRKAAAFVSMDNEANLPTWFSTVLLLACAALAWTIARAEHAIGARRWRHWIGVVAIFLYLSLDEAGRLHERFINPLRDLLGAGGALQYTWIVVAIPVVIAVVVIYAGFVRDLPRRPRALVIGGAILYVGGAIGMEAVSGAYRDAHGAGLGFGLLTTGEETLEMTGVLLAIAGLGAYFNLRFAAVELRLRESHAPAA